MTGQPAPRLAAVAPAVTVASDPGDPTGMTAVLTVDNHGHGPVLITWGQTPPLPTSTNPGDNTTPSRRRYTRTGTWDITLTPLDTAVPAATVKLAVPVQAAPTLTVRRDPAVTSGLGVIVTVDNRKFGAVTLDWGQTPPLAASTNPGDGSTPTSQTYTAAGTWTITARDADRIGALPATATITLPYPGPDDEPVISVVHPERPGAMAVAVVVDNHGRGPVDLDWGHNPPMPTVTHPGDGRTVVRQKYVRPGTWMITATDRANPATPAGTALLRVPVLPDATPTLHATYDPADPTGMTVQLTVDNQGRGPLNVDWGQWPKLPVAASAGDGTTVLRGVFTRPGTWTITATDPAAHGVTGSIVVPVPNPLTPPKVTISRDFSVPMGLGVAVVVDNHGRGPVVLEWGQDPALPTSTNPGDGTSVTKQTYTRAGNWPLTVRSAHNALVRAQPIASVPPVDSQAAPVVYPKRVEGDPWSVDLAVHNYHYGPVLIQPDVDDPQPVVSNSGDGVTLTRVTYPPVAGTHTLSAASALVPDARAGSVEIPLPLPTDNPIRGVHGEVIACSGGVCWIAVTLDSDSHDALIDWGDDDYPMTPLWNNGDKPTNGLFYVPGIKHITARAYDNPSATNSVTVATPDHFPDEAIHLTVSQDTDELTGFGVTVKASCSLGDVLLDWGQNPPLPTVTTDGSAPVHQLYTAPGTWRITATSVDDPALLWVTYFTVPQPSPQQPPTIRCWDTGTDANRLSVAALVNNYGNGEVSIDWGDGTAQSANAGNWSQRTEHTYAKAGSYTVTAADKDNPRAPKGTWSFSVPWPAPPKLVITEDGVDVDTLRINTRVTVVDPPRGQRYSVCWGSERPPSQWYWLSMPADGSSGGSSANAGAHEVIVQPAVQGALGTTAKYTTPYTGPQVKVSWTPPAGGKTTATCEVIGARKDVAYEVQWGEGAQFTAVPAAVGGGHPTATRQLASPGVYVITVREKNDHSATASAHIWPR